LKFVARIQALVNEIGYLESSKPLILEEEDLPVPCRCQPLPTATYPNSDVQKRIQQTIRTLKAKNNSKQAYSKILHRVFFFFCTVSGKYSLNQPAFSQLRLQMPYLIIPDKSKLAELSGKKRKTGNLYAIRINQK
jgi:hypothetical protein